MRRLGALLVILAVVVAARFALKRPVAVELDVDYGAAAPSLRAVELVFTGADERVERTLQLAYPSGAPPRDHRTVRLPQGSYTVGARLSYDARPALTTSVPLRVDQAGTYTVELRP